MTWSLRVLLVTCLFTWISSTSPMAMVAVTLPSLQDRRGRRLRLTHKRMKAT